MSTFKNGIQWPRYLLRRHIILNLLRRYEPGRFLEIGCGRGELMPWLLRRGFEGTGLEIAPEALAMAKKAVAPYEPRLRVVGEPETIRGKRFRYVFAFEVLEHLEDDAGALVEWRQWLEPDGRLVVSVPAHMSKWTEADDFVGHCRRYERDEFRQTLALCGYSVEVFWNYGFPLTNLTRHFRPLIYRSRLRAVEGIGREERTLRSSLDAIRVLGRSPRPLRFLLEGGVIGFHLLQLTFRNFDLGDGFIVACRPQ